MRSDVAASAPSRTAPLFEVRRRARVLYSPRLRPTLLLVAALGLGCPARDDGVCRHAVPAECAGPCCDRYACPGALYEVNCAPDGYCDCLRDGKFQRDFQTPGFCALSDAERRHSGAVNCGFDVR